MTTQDQPKQMSINELFALLVLRLRLDAEYVLDKMTISEMNALLQYSYYSDEQAWEQTRFMTYCNVQMQTRKKLKLSDILTFAWDTNNVEHVSEADRERLRALAKSEENKLNHGK